MAVRKVVALLFGNYFGTTMRDPAYVKLKFKKHSMVKKGEKQNLDPD